MPAAEPAAASTEEVSVETSAVPSANAEPSASANAGINQFYLMIAVMNVKETVKAKAEEAVLKKLPSHASKGPKILPKLAGMLASKAVTPEKVMTGVAGGLGKELPEKLKSEVGLSLEMETVFVTGPLVVIQVQPLIQPASQPLCLWCTSLCLTCLAPPRRG